MNVILHLMFSYSDIFFDKQRILFVTAHPDDLVAFFGGLAYQLRQDNKDVFALLVTSGGRGSRQNEVSVSALAQQRLAEEAACLRILGIDEAHSFCLEYPDGEVESNLKLIGDIAKYIRKFSIDLVATHEPSLQYLADSSGKGFSVQHRDHRKIGEAVIDAVYPYSRDRSFFPEHAAEGLQPCQVFDILLTDEKDCNFKFDLNDTVEVKRRAMQAHQTQFSDETIEAILNSFAENGQNVEKFNYLKLLW